MSKGSYVLIKPQGEDEAVIVDKVSLEKAQDLVGGYVEVVPMFNRYLGASCVVLCDEEGKLKGKDRNNRATLEWYKCTGPIDDLLVGNVLVLMGSTMKDWA